MESRGKLGRMSGEDWLEVRRAVAAGQTQEAAARAAGVNERTLQRLLRRTGGIRRGKQGKIAIGPLVERRSRYVLLLHLPEGRTAPHVREALTHQIGQLPEALRRTLTWDQGKEMAEHARFTLDTDVQVYFCDPHSPWQRGSNENTNGLLRQYFPKGMDLSSLSRIQLDAVAHQLNTRPRQTLDWCTPAEVFAQSVAMTG